jgi:hypothetical protein
MKHTRNTKIRISPLFNELLGGAYMKHGGLKAGVDANSIIALSSCFVPTSHEPD